jgi:hypothetical protein
VFVWWCLTPLSTILFLVYIMCLKRFGVSVCNSGFTYGVKDRVMVFNATFNTISVISWRSVLLVEETGVRGENHRPVSIHRQTWSHNVLSRKLLLSGIRTYIVSEAGFTYRLGRLKASASKSRGNPAKMYDKFDTVICPFYIRCNNAL